MAPNPKGGRPPKPQLHGRMVQPALPLIPRPIKGKQQQKKSKQATSEQVVETTSEKQKAVEAALKTSDAAVNGDKQEHGEVLKPSDAAVNGASNHERGDTVEAPAKAPDATTTGEGETEHVDFYCAPTQGPTVETPRKSSTPSVAQVTPDSTNLEDNNSVAGEDSFLSQVAADSQATNEAALGRSSEQETNAKEEQETVSLTNGHLSNASEPISSASGEDYDEHVSAMESFAQADEMRAFGGAVNGTLSSPPPQENGHMTPEEAAQSHEGSGGGQSTTAQVYGSAAVKSPQQDMNGGGGSVHDPMAMSGTSRSVSESIQQQQQEPRDSTGLAPLQDYLLQISHTKEGVDWAIQVNPPGVQPYVLYAHSFLMLRSDRLRRLMQREPSSSTYGGNVIHLYPASNAVPHAFDAALRFLYSDTVLSHLIQPHPGPDFHAARLQNLDYILSYWVAGIELGIDQVSVCAERLLFNYVDWDILEVTYKHAIDLANSPVVSSGKNTTGSDYVVASNAIIRPILHFLAARMDVTKFKVDTAGAPIHFATRFPMLDGNRVKHKPALASMVFGSMPSSADMSPTSPQSELMPASTATFRDTVATNILLNIDFEHLFYFNSILQRNNIAGAPQLMASIIAEREVRRQKIQSSQTVANKDRMANSTAWEVVGWKEEWDGETNLPKRERVGFLS
ncbi:uncharacterized protein PV06_01419 [Exophiala oligosperma]|uniref:BTB domain-containing protein n=1 Tax=Exophiala oligosperma TaxID=215243 RepID=A0A0D2E0B7_9EURO|nr:uncharacterized protein PV06_01419 [Exophiala oligosperma]KIW48858.1 hypothetical protein PV06_01419 [Exophiala oligosperma]